jgi:hypothetical protein
VQDTRPTAGHQADQLAFMKTGLHQYEVVEVTRSQPGVVGHEGVARAHRAFGDHVEEMFNRLGHGVDMPRCAGYRLRQHVAVDVENAGGDVAAFSNDRAEGGVHQRLRLFVDDRDQPVPHDLQFDRRSFIRHWFCLRLF